MRVAAVTGHALLEFVFGQVLHDLGENGTSEVHPPFCGLLLPRPKQPISAARSSNRKTRVSGYQSDSAQVFRFQKNLSRTPVIGSHHGSNHFPTLLCFSSYNLACSDGPVADRR